jgi:hypothetical protein
MKHIRNNDGFVKPLIIIIILVLLVYSGFQFGVPYYKHSTLKSDAKEMARISLGREDKLQTMLFKRIDELGVPVNRNDVYVKNLGNTMHVKISWTDEVDILGFYQKQLFFNIDIRE